MTERAVLTFVTPMTAFCNDLLTVVVGEIHTRMPVILPEEHHDAWLSGEAGKGILVAYPPIWDVEHCANCPDGGGR
jgi:putative SOS response-associated peptidase YedK